MRDRKPMPMCERVGPVVRERASASPVSIPSHSRSATRAGPKQPPLPLALAQLQHWFAESITGRVPIDQAVLAAPILNDVGDLERVVVGGPRLGALGRMAIHQHGYRARLVECLADDYPALQAALGDEAFERLVHGYAERHPSRSPSLNFFGRHVSGFLLDSDLGCPWDHRCLSDLARLEWTLVELVHAEAAPTLSLEHLASLPAERWAHARFAPSPTARVLRFAYPVNTWYQRWRDGGELEPPDARIAATLVYRHDLHVWRLDLTPAMTNLLEALFAGQPLSAALEHLAEGIIDADELTEAERTVMIWFREWVQGGVFARIDLPSD